VTSGVADASDGLPAASTGPLEPDVEPLPLLDELLDELPVTPDEAPSGPPPDDDDTEGPPELERPPDPFEGPITSVPG
jgi:hypothetical protein